MCAPDLNWDAMLKITKTELELIPDPGIYIFFGKVQEVEFLMFLIDTVKPTKYFDPKQESKRIMYLDENNLYGYTVSKFHPTSEFKCIDLKEFNLNKYTSNISKGCVVDVDLEYPIELPELHNDYP